METDPPREYDTLEDVVRSSAYEIPGLYSLTLLNLNKHRFSFIFCKLTVIVC